VAYLAPESLPRLKENVLGLRKQVDDLKTKIFTIEAKSNKSEAFASWLSKANIECSDVYLPHKPSIGMEFVKGETDEKDYGIRRNDWSDFKMKVTYVITNSFGTIMHEGTLPILPTRTFKLTKENLTKEFNADRYRLMVSARMGEPSTTVASVIKEFEVRKDLAPPLIRWLQKDYTGEKLTISAEVKDGESGLASVMIVYRFVLIAGPNVTSHSGIHKMTELQSSVYFFNFKDTNPPFDLTKANIAMYYIEARDMSENVAYSEPVKKGPLLTALSSAVSVSGPMESSSYSFWASPTSKVALCQKTSLQD